MSKIRFAKKALELILNLEDKDALSLLIIGPAGCGKTCMTRQAARENGYIVKEYNLSCLTHDDFSPALVSCEQFNEGVHTGIYHLEYLAPLIYKDIMDAYKKNPKVVVFFDELSNADGSTLKATMPIILEKKFCSLFPLPSSVRIVCAMNEGYKYNAELNEAMYSRFLVVYNEEDQEAWEYGYRSGFRESVYSDSFAIEKNVDVRNGLYHKLRDLLPTFFSENVSYFSKTDDMSDEHSFTCERTIEFVNNLLPYTYCNDKSFNKRLIKGVVGTRTANALIDFLYEKEPNVINLFDYEKSPKSFEFRNPDAADDVAELTANIIYLFYQYPERFFGLWKRCMVLLHNRDNKYGNYNNYDMIIMKYLINDIKFIVHDIKLVDGPGVAKLSEELEGVFELYAAR